MIEHIEKDFLKSGYLLGLRFLDPTTGTTKVYVCQVLGQEPCNAIYSFGSVNANDNTDFVELKDGTRSVLVPTDMNEVKHVYYGISPTRAMIYFKIADKDRWSLYATRSVGSYQGYVDGRMSPFNSPSLRTKLFVVKDIVPYFCAYNPLPESVTIKLNIIGRRYKVRWIDARKLPKEMYSKIRVEDVAEGMDPVERPDWLKIEGISFEAIVGVKGR